MRDEDFQYFISKFGEPTQRTDVPTESVEKWRGKLPDQLLTYWKEEGWCGYSNGLFWTVNPEEYQDVLREWLKETPLEKADTFHVIARTAFGDLFLWGESCGDAVTVSPGIHTITALAKNILKSVDDPAFDIRTFFSCKKKKYCELNDDLGEPLFERALQKLAPLNADEMYGFEPALVLGGTMRLENLVKVNLDVHLTILRQLAPPQMPFSNTGAPISTSTSCREHPVASVLALRLPVDLSNNLYQTLIVDRRILCFTNGCGSQLS